MNKLTYVGAVRGVGIEAVEVATVVCPCGYQGVAAPGVDVAYCPDCGIVLWERVCDVCGVDVWQPKGEADSQ